MSLGALLKMCFLSIQCWQSTSQPRRESISGLRPYLNLGILNKVVWEVLWPQDLLNNFARYALREFTLDDSKKRWQFISSKSGPQIFSQVIYRKRIRLPVVTGIEILGHLVVPQRDHGAHPVPIFEIYDSDDHNFTNICQGKNLTLNI